MTPTAPTAAGGLVELRFLIPLRHQQEVLHVAFLAVLAKEPDRPLELLELFLGRRRLRPPGALEVLRQQLVALPRLLDADHERVQLDHELRAIFANHPGDVAARAYHDVRVHGELGEDLLPERADVRIDDGHLDEAGVHHLEDVLDLEVLGRQPDLHRHLLRPGELRVELLEAFVKARRPAHVDFLPGQILHGPDRIRAGSGDQDLRDVAQGRIG
ncbi:MAG: hypothetical protein ACRELZ_27065, partial [Candidatus Rokuibacteriota bacterium]